MEVRKLDLSRAELLSQLAFSNKHFRSLDVQLALRKCGTLTKLGWTFENMGNEPSSTSMLVRPLVDRHGIFVSTDSLWDWEIGWNFQDFKSWNIQQGQKNTRQLRTPGWKQPRHAGRWLAIFFFYSLSLQIKSFLQYFCVVFITKWLPWQPYITKPIINYELVVMATGFHDNRTKLFNFHQYISFYKNNIQLHFDTKCKNYT